MTDTKPDLVFDLDSYEDVESAEIVIKTPDGAPTAFIITLAGPEHPVRRRIDFDRQRRLRAGLQKTGQLQLGTPEDDFEDETDQLAACTLGWRGGSVEFSAAAARALYDNPKRRWIREQVKAGLAERERFIRRSAAT